MDIPGEEGKALLVWSQTYKLCTNLGLQFWLVLTRAKSQALPFMSVASDVAGFLSTIVKDSLSLPDPPQHECVGYIAREPSNP